MRGDQKWQSRLAQAVEDGDWGVLDVYSDGGADGAGTPAASAEYGWLVGGTDGDSLEVWAEGAARVGGLSEEMDSTRAELLSDLVVYYRQHYGLSNLVVYYRQHYGLSNLVVYYR